MTVRADRGPCSVTSCEKPVRSLGLCEMHYMRQRRHGDVHVVKRVRMYAGQLCSIEGCEKKARARELCSFHWQRQWKGTPLDQPKQIHSKRGEGRHVHPSGYVWAYVPPGTPGRGSNGRMLEHRKVMQIYLGRPLKKTETVHHMNGNRQDNRIENLELRIGSHGVGATAPHCGTCTCWRDVP
jgi:hypothetical protein